MHRQVTYGLIADERELAGSLDDMDALMRDVRTGKDDCDEVMTPQKRALAARMLASFCLAVAHYLEHTK